MQVEGHPRGVSGWDFGTPKWNPHNAWQLLLCQEGQWSSGRFAFLYAMGRQYWDELYAHRCEVNYRLSQSGVALTGMTAFQKRLRYALLVEK
jgi:hypothetical protein